MGKEQFIGRRSRKLSTIVSEVVHKQTSIPVADVSPVAQTLEGSLNGTTREDSAGPKLADRIVVSSATPVIDLPPRDVSLDVSIGAMVSLSQTPTEELPLNRSDLISGIADLRSGQTPAQPSNHLATQIAESPLISPANAGANSAEAITKSANQVTSDSAEVARQLAFTQLYDEHIDRVYRYFLYKVGVNNRPLAEDLTADVFLKAWNHFAGFQDRKLPFEHWLMRIASRVVIDHWRKENHRRGDATIDELCDSESNEIALDKRVSRDLEVEVLAKAIKGLPSDQQDVLINRFIEGYSHADTASALGKSEVAVRQIQVRALQKLRKILTQGEFEESLPTARSVQVRK